MKFQKLIALLTAAALAAAVFAAGHLWITIQNQFRIRQRIVVDEPVQFRPLETAIRNFVLYSGAINGNHAVVRIS